MALLVYVLGALTSAGCATLLLREYRRNRSRLLLWMLLAFVGFTLSNILVFLDFVVLPDVNLAIPRACMTLIASSLLVIGLVWDAD